VNPKLKYIQFSNLSNQTCFYNINCSSQHSREKNTLNSSTPSKSILLYSELMCSFCVGSPSCRKITHSAI